MNAIKADPNNGGARIMQAQVYLALGDGVAAAAEIERARALGISAEDSRHLMAHALLLQNEPKRALAESATVRSEEHTSELQSLMRISYAVFCLKKKKKHKQQE